MTHHAASADLIAAFRRTNYCVHTDPRMTLHIGKSSPQLLDLHRSHKVNSSVFITACNPLSQLMSEDENAKRMGQLCNELTQRSLTFFEGVGQNPSMEWPGEPSYLVLDMSMQAAMALGRKYEQHAIVFSEFDALPQLILLTGSAPA